MRRVEPWTERPTDQERVVLEDLRLDAELAMVAELSTKVIGAAAELEEQLPGRAMRAALAGRLGV